MKFPTSRFIAAFAVTLFATAASAVARPGSLDKSFHNTGFTTLESGGMEYIQSVAMMADGRIVAAGYNAASGSGDVLVMCFKPNGYLDDTFSGDGRVILNLDTIAGVNTYELATAIAVQPDGKILLTGYTNAGGTEDENIFVLRYNLDGSPDVSFGEGGRVISHFHNHDRASSIIALSNGKILVGGTTGFGAGTNDFFVTCYESDGSYDPTFTANGKGWNIVGYDTCRAMAVQADGRIVLVGDTDNVSNLDFAVVRLNANGELDKTFAADGYLITPTAGNASASAVEIQPDGKILVAGTINESNTMDRRDFGLVRYTSTGALDPTFSGDGKLTYNLGQSSRAGSMILQKDGRIVLIGGTNYGLDPDLAMVRFSGTGNPDKTFGTNGKVVTDFGGYDLLAAAVAQADGKIFVFGSSDGDSTLARYNMVMKTDAIVGTKANGAKGDDVYNSNGTGQVLNLSVKRNGGKELSYVRIQNDGDSEEVFTIKGSAGNNALQVRYLDGGKNVTSQVTKGIFQTRSLAPGASFQLKVEITAKTKMSKILREFAIIGRSLTDSSSRDTVLIKAKSK